MPLVTKCPNCDKKLKMKEPTPGKKVRCPACKEPFVPVAASGAPASKKAAPKKKKRPAPVDDYDDDGYDDDYGDDSYDDEPKPKRAAASGKRKSSSKSKKAPAKAKSKAPLLIGASVLAVGLAAGITYFLWPAEDSPAGAGGSEVAATDGANQLTDGDAGMAVGDDADGDAAAAMAAEMGMGEGDGAAESNAESNAEPSYATNTPVNSGNSTPPTTAGGFSDFGSPAASQGSSVPVTTNYSQDGPVDLAYLPAKAEAVAKLDVGRLLEGPLGQFLQLPQVAPQIQQFEQMLGMKPQDIESVTIGIGGLTDAIASGQEPNPSVMPLTAVIRTKAILDGAKLQSMIPGGESVSEGSMTYVRVPNPEGSAGIWFVDSNTVVVGNESSVKQVGTNPDAPTYVDAAIMDGASPIQIMFSPTNPDAVFRHPKAQIPPGGPVPPAAMAVAKNFLAYANSAFIGLDLTNDLGVNLTVRCKDSGAATQMVADLKAASEESKAAQANQPPNPMMMPFMGIQKAMEDSQKIEATGDICRTTQSAPGGGQVLGNFIPMAMAMIGPAIQQAQQAAKRVESKNNLKQIGLAMMNFHDVYSRFPNSASSGPNGEPLLSWRVHLLGFLGHEDLYNKFALDEPWDSPTNMALVSQMPEVYRAPRSSLEPGKTIYVVPVGSGTAFEQQKGRSMREFSDGISNTVLLVEGAEQDAVIWTQPVDLEFNALNPTAGLRRSQSGAYQVMLADGSVRAISDQTDTNAVKSMFTRSGAD